METYTSIMMDIHTEMTETMFDGMVAVEQVDEDKLNKLINSNLLKQSCNGFNNAKYDNEQQQLKEYQNIVKMVVLIRNILKQILADLKH